MKDRLVAGGLVALSLLSAACGGGSPSSSAGCTTDIDCKGTRICQAGVCVDDSSNTGGTDGTGGAGGAGAGGAGTGTAPSNSSGATSAAAAYCQHPASGSCNCQVDQGGPNQASCGPALLGGPSVCCAADTWPQAGSSCSCALYECNGNSAGSDCGCGGLGGANTSATATCGGQVCCAGNGTGSPGDPAQIGCMCLSAAEGACSELSGYEQAVPSCALTDIGDNCGSGYHAVTECR
jgi:hypothetical protein